MYILKFFGDKHNDATAMIALTNALPIFKKYGYDTLFLESPYEGADIDETIELTNESINIITLFPDGIIPEEKTPDQEKLIINMLPHYDNYDHLAFVVKKTYDAEKTHLDSHKQRILMLEQLKNFNMRLVNIDVRRPYEYNKPGDLEKRNKIMFENIKKNFSASNKAIVFVGIAHIVDIWEAKKFNSGIKSLVLKESDNFDIERCKTYLLYSSEDEIIKDVYTKIDRNNNEIIKRIQPIKISAEFNFIENLESDLKNEIDRPLIVRSSNENNSRYFIPSSPNPDYLDDNQTFYYLVSLGGKFIRKVKKDELMDPFLDAFLFELPVSSLDKKAKRQILNIDRVFIPVQDEGILDYLRDNIKTLTIDKVERPSGAKGFYLTFFDDSGLRNKKFGYITNREYIEMAKDAIKYQPVIDYLDHTLNRHLKWKLKYGENNEPLAILKDSHFNNQSGANLYVEEFKQKGLKQVYLKEEEEGSNIWHIIIADLSNILEDLKNIPHPFSKLNIG